MYNLSFKYLFILIVLAMVVSCSISHNEKHQSEKYMGMYIDNEPRTGSFYKDTNGLMYNYRNLITTISNDSIMPVYLKITFSNKPYCPTPANGQQFSVFLLPEDIIQKQYIDGGLSKELKTFLDHHLDKPTTLSKVINPHEKFTFSMGVLTDTNYYDPSQLALISGGPRPRFYMHESQINEANLKNNPNTLSLALDFFRFSPSNSLSGYSVIPCGQFSFSK